MSKVTKPTTVAATLVTPVQHVTENQIPFSTILRKQSVYTYKQLSEFLKSLESSSQSDNDKKRHFLELLVQLRNNFVRLYVICKWARNSGSVGKLIDLFVWLREQNQAISNALAQLGTQKQSLMSAKIPNPDLSTALEVLVKGRPQLPTHNFLPDKKVEPALVLKTLRELDVILSTKMALIELPKPFYKYTVKDGRAVFQVEYSFICAVSVANENTRDSEANPFYLVDFKLGFRSEDLKLVPAVASLPPGTFHHLERLANFALAKEGLEGLYTLLHEYSITCKLYTLHRQLLTLRMGLWRGHLTHIYHADRCVLVITYWAQCKAPKSTIEIGKMSQTGELGFRWIKEGKLYTDHNLILMKDGSIDIEGLIRKVIALHIQLGLEQIKAQLAETIENSDKFCEIYGENQLILNASRTRTVVYSIDPLSGDGYFQNPDPVMRRVARQINADPSAAYVGLLRLRLETQVQELSVRLKATGWRQVPAVKMPGETLGANTEYLKAKQLLPQLFTLLFFRRQGWPAEWFLVAGVPGFATQPQFWVSRLRSMQGAWSVLWQSSLAVPAKADSYGSLLQLVEKSSSAMVCHLMVEELEQHGCQLKTPKKDDESVQQFIKKDLGTTIGPDDVAILLLDNKSLYSVPNARDTLVLIATIVGDPSAQNATLQVRIFGKLQQAIKFNEDDSSSAINMSNESGSSVTIDRNSDIFTISSQSDLAERLGGGNAVSSPDPSSLLGLSPSSNSSQTKSILGDSLSILKRLSEMLTLLQLVVQDPELKLLDLSLDRMSFQYGNETNESLTLKISEGESIEIEMPPTNPHQLCLRYLNAMVSQDSDSRNIGELVTYLRITLPLYKSYLALSDEKAKTNKAFNESQEKLEAKDLKSSPGVGYALSMPHFETFSILYYASCGQKVKERFKCILSVSLRHRSHKVSLKSSVYLATLEIHPGREDAAKIAAKVTGALQKYFTSGNIPVKGANVVPLKTGLVCEYKNVGAIISFLHGEILKVIY